MTRSKKRLDDFLGHILQAIERIALYTENLDESGFMQNLLVQDAVIRNIEIVGEASYNIIKHYPEFVRDHQDLPLASAYQMRNAVAHGYFTVDMGIVWSTIRKELPALHRQVQSICDSDTHQSEPSPRDLNDE